MKPYLFGNWAGQWRLFDGWVWIRNYTSTTGCKMRRVIYLPGNHDAFTHFTHTFDCSGWVI